MMINWDKNGKAFQCTCSDGYVPATCVCNPEKQKRLPEYDRKIKKQMKAKKYFRIDKIPMEFVNCPNGIRLLSKCEKCFLFKGIEKIYPSNFVECDFKVQLKKLKMIKIDKSEWKTKNPKMFEYDSKNHAVDIFVREDKRCPFPFHEEDWYHQGQYIKDFIIMLNQFFEKNKLPYTVLKNDL